jgi:hypothetical protein
VGESQVSKPKPEGDGKFHLGIRRKGEIEWAGFESVVDAKQHLFKLESKRGKPFKHVLLLDNDGNHVSLLYGHTEISNKTKPFKELSDRAKLDQFNAAQPVTYGSDPITIIANENVADAQTLVLQKSLAIAEGKLAAIRRILSEDNTEADTSPEDDVLADIQADVVHSDTGQLTKSAAELFEEARQADAKVLAQVEKQRD